MSCSKSACKIRHITLYKAPAGTLYNIRQRNGNCMSMCAKARACSTHHAGSYEHAHCDGGASEVQVIANLLFFDVSSQQ